MDFWELVKVMWRRWYVTAPMLMITAIGALGALVSVGPEFQATGHVAVVPPEVQRFPSGGQPTRVNPWNAEALAHAAIIRLESKRQADQLHAGGYLGEWAVEMTGTLPVISIEVVAPTAEEATRTMHRLQAVVDDEVSARQVEYSIAEGERIMTVRYDQGESIATTASRLRRTLVAVVGAGLILTAGVAVGFDALARWRWSRRSVAQPEPQPVAAAAATEPPRRRYSFAVDGPIAATGAPANGSPARGPVAEFPLAVKLPTASPASGSGSEAATETITRLSDPLAPSGGSAPPDPGDHPSTESEDSTIVIPLSHSPWAGRRNGGRPSDGDHGPSAETRTR